MAYAGGGGGGGVGERGGGDGGVEVDDTRAEVVVKVVEVMDETMLDVVAMAYSSDIHEDLELI